MEVNYHLSHITNSLQKKIVFQPGSPGDSQRSRRHWLQSNQPLLRMFLSYCSLHGSHGGGLASVRMELILLLQESHQVIKTCASALSQGCKQTQENRQKALPTVLSYRAFSWRRRWWSHDGEHEREAQCHKGSFVWLHGCSLLSSSSFEDNIDSQITYSLILLSRLELIDEATEAHKDSLNVPHYTQLSFQR